MELHGSVTWAFLMHFQYEQYDLVFLHTLNFTFMLVSIKVKALFLPVH